MSKGKIAFIGSGMIGTGLAVNFILSGYEAVLQTRRQVELAHTRMEQMLRTLEENQVITARQAAQAKERYQVTTCVQEALEGAIFVQESGPEDLERKKELIAQIEACVGEDVPIASATSSFLPSQLQEGAVHPERILVGHPYHPAYLIPLVEVCGSPASDPNAIRRAKELYQDAGKEAIVARKEKSGSIVNRLSRAANAEAKQTVVEGICSVEEMDKAIIYGPGLRMAVLGQITTIGIGMGPNGYYDSVVKYGVPMTPEKEIIAKGYEEALASRDPATGTDYESVSAWRDKMLIGFLRVLGRL